MEKDTVTNEKLAWMISKGFTGLERRFDGVEDKLDRLTVGICEN